MAIIHGRNVKIYNSSGTALIAAAKSCTINMSGDIEEVASTSSGTAREFIPGRTTWSVDLTHLVTTNQGGIPLVGTSYTIRYMVGSTQVYTGTVICTEANITSTLGNLSQGSIKMKGSGQLS